MPKLLVILLSLLLISETTLARPKIGLVLGGGGAKGGAHIGVLKILKANNIPIDYIVGTSIGSVVGGMYATGLTVEEIEKIMFETTWDDGYSDTIPRENLPWRVKQQTNVFNVPLRMGIRDHQLQLPSGLLYGQSSTKILRKAFSDHPNFNSFDDLVIPYRAIATDLVSNEAVILNKGSLFSAMRASTGVPGALAPEEIDGLLLVDGGITKNLPVDVVREMGADIIIAVDIGSALLGKEDLQGTLTIIDQLSSFLTNSNTISQRDNLLKHDFLIMPDISGLSTTDWSILEEALKRGETAASQQLEYLSALSINDKDYNEYLFQLQQNRKTLVARIEKPTNTISLTKRTNISEDYILEKINLTTGHRMEATEINDAIDRLYSIDEFQRVEAQTIINNDDKTINFVIEDKSWGPNYLEFGIGWEDDLDSNSDINFNTAYTLGNLTKHGGELRSELELGTERTLQTELYIPLTSKRKLYSSSRYKLRSYTWDIYYNNQPFVPVSQKYHTVSQGIGYHFIQEGYLELGVTADNGSIDEAIFSAGTIDYYTYGSYFEFGIDTLDSIDFPTQGSYFSFSSTYRNESVKDHSQITKTTSDDDISSIVVDINWKSAIKFNNHGVVAKASYFEAFTQDGNESIYTSFLGGFLNLSGFHKNELVGDKKAFFAGIYQFDLGKSLLNMEQHPLYLGLSLEAGNVWQHGEEIDHEDLILASSIFIGTDTSLGPVSLGFGKADQGVHSLYFYLGTNF